MDVCICDPNTHRWTSSVRPAMRDVYVGYKERRYYYREKPYVYGEYIVYRTDNDPYLPTYIAQVTDAGVDADAGAGAGAELIVITREIHERMDAQGKTTPIMDLADIFVFITDPAVVGSGRANWFPARSYQAWAYRDYMYDPHRTIRKSYMSHGTSRITYEGDSRILVNQMVTIPIPGISANIVFTIARNETGSVYFERNDAMGSQSRICDNEYARIGYLGFYTRLTMDPGMIVMPPVAAGAGAGAGAALLSTTHLSSPEETNDEERQCMTCVRNRVNARFSPCDHQVCCSACYLQFTKNECPVCRAVIAAVMNV